MENLRDIALDAITKLPDSADIDDIMYRLYVIDKVRKGRQAIKEGQSVSSEELLKDIESW